MKTLALLVTICLFTAVRQPLRAQELIVTQVPGSNEFNVQCPTETGRTYFFEASTDLIEWKFAPAILFGNDTLRGFCFPQLGERYYIRVHHVVPALPGVDPETEDTDGDGISNIDEILIHKTNPADLDPDRDGLTNQQEIAAGSNMNRFDMPELTVKAQWQDAEITDYRTHNETEPLRYLWSNYTSRELNVKATNTSTVTAPATSGHTRTDWTTTSRNLIWAGTPNITTQTAVTNIWNNSTAPYTAAFSWGVEAQGAITTGAWMLQSFNIDANIKLHSVRARKVRVRLHASRAMPLPFRTKTSVFKSTRNTPGGELSNPVEQFAQDLLIPQGQTTSDYVMVNPASTGAPVPATLNATNLYTINETHYTIRISPWDYVAGPLPPETPDADHDGLPDSVELSMGTNPASADTDADGRTDFFDFLAPRPVVLASGAGGSGAAATPTTSPSPLRPEEPDLYYINRTGHTCPPIHIIGFPTTRNTILFADVWLNGHRLKFLSAPPANPIVGIQNAWTSYGTPFQLNFPNEAAAADNDALDTHNARMSVLDPLFGDQRFRRSFTSLRSYNYGGSTGNQLGGDAEETKVRLQLSAAPASSVTRSYLRVDRQKADDSTSVPWTINSTTPVTFTIPASAKISNEYLIPLPSNVPPAAGKASRHENILIPVEVVDAKKITISKLKVGKMSEAGVLGGTEASATLDIEKDSDRFYVRVKGGAALGGISVKISTADNPDTAYDDNTTQIDLIADGSDFISKSMLLVSDDVDDDHPVDGIADDATGDRTHKIQLGGSFKIEEIKIATGAWQPLSYKVPAPLEKTVTVSVIILRQTSGGAPVIAQMAVEQDMKVAQERYAQVGIKLVWSITIENPPPGVDLSDKFDEYNWPGTPTAEEKALFNASFVTVSQADIQIFYVNELSQGSAGEAFWKAAFNAPLSDNVIVSAQRRPFTLPHELGHILENSGRHVPPPTNLLRGGTSTLNTLGASKRLDSTQEQTLKGSSHAN